MHRQVDDGLMTKLHGKPRNVDRDGFARRADGFVFRPVLSFLIGTLLPILLIIGVLAVPDAPDCRAALAAPWVFGKSKAKLLTEAHGRVTFDDVAGVDEAKQ